MTVMATPLRSVPEPVEGQTDPLDEDPSFERFFDTERARLFGALAFTPRVKHEFRRA